MRIGVMGATGTIGRAVRDEARSRDHEVVACSRRTAQATEPDEGVRWARVDPLDSDAVGDAVLDVDVMVSAINAGSTVEQQIASPGILPEAARVLLRAGERRTNTRLIWVGGGGSLEVTPGRRLLDDEDALLRTIREVLDMPDGYAAVVRAQAEVLDLCRLSNRLWTYVSPVAGRIPTGARTGRYRLGGDAVTTSVARPDDDASNHPGSDLTAQDLAVAILDEIDVPRFVQRRFSVDG